jgi:NAD(P)-dependent dehydrogenase (short-subunit alcohol dehydrogenase family)
VCCPLPLSPRCGSANTAVYQEFAVVTGGNRGVGYQAALALAQDGHNVILLCRNRALGVEAAKRISKAAGCGTSRVWVRVADLGDLASLGRFAAEFDDAGAVGSSPTSGYGGYDDRGVSCLAGCGKRRRYPLLFHLRASSLILVTSSRGGIQASLPL